MANIMLLFFGSNSPLVPDFIKKLFIDFKQITEQDDFYDISHRDSMITELSQKYKTCLNEQHLGSS